MLLIRHHGVRRRFILALLGVVALAGIVAIARLGFEWKQALDDVDAMIVTPVVLALTPEPILNAPAPADALVSAASAIPTIAPTAAPENDDPVNILLLGTDARADEEISRTDAIILLHINLRTGRVSMLSFPRDLMVDAPGFGRRKINSVYLLGETRLGKGYGAALLKRTVSDLVGVPVHYFALINFDGFRKVIDLAGGIFIDVPRVIDDPFYPVDAFPGDTRTMRVRFEPGRQWMDGERALIYARTRHADSDFGRNQRQQQVLLALIERVREHGLISQINKIDDYTSALRDYVRTDLPRSEMIRLARAATRLDLDNIQRYAIDSRMIITLGNPDTFAADPEAVREIVDRMIAGGAPAP
ncbi:MAG: LCP family protein [Roseiflexus sp.]|nr:LCP family protein [Roseiflexus sp.]MCS7288576.1 LCP family protein [Roseiflexus sp.]MDW8145286.1 LCP family protein [Roseiflexaceae bacterium]MDW8232043.1 LCP family protein [Roseiflexaceae bacterium]